MKKFFEPEIEIIKLSIEDIMNESPSEDEEPDAGDNGLGWG